jgi:hypothetical protein
MDHTLTKGMQETRIRKKRFKRNTGKPSSTRRQPVKGVKNATQIASHSNPKTDQNGYKARDDYHKKNESNKDKSRKMEISKSI